MVLRILHPILLHILPLSAFENAHREPRIREYRTIVDRDRELCTKAAARDQARPAIIKAPGAILTKLARNRRMTTMLTVGATNVLFLVGTQ